MTHPSWSLEPWGQFTSGVPAALHEPPGLQTVAEQVAELQGCESATLVPSTLHAFWDLFGVLAGEHVEIYMDFGVYPIARWGVERAKSRGVVARSFRHHDAAALHAQLKQCSPLRATPVVVCDGLCPACGDVAPLAAYLEIARTRRGSLVIDDTQALGILGTSPSAEAPYGKGGGGSLRWSGINGPDVIAVSSMAKGFGVPMAVMAGGFAFMQHFSRASETRLHCSPPSIAAILAAEHAMVVNRRCGDTLRLRLAQLVQYFRCRLSRVGLTSIGSLFPVQTVRLPGCCDPKTIHDRMISYGVQTVLHRKLNQRRPRISFIINARHRKCEIEYSVSALAAAAQGERCEEVDRAMQL